MILYSLQRLIMKETVENYAWICWTVNTERHCCNGGLSEWRQGGALWRKICFIFLW